MKVAASALFLGAAAAAVSSPQQQPLQAAGPKQSQAQPQQSASDNSLPWVKPWKALQNELHHLTADAQQVWEEVAMMFPESMKEASFFTPPKKHTRKPDSHWDFITSGQKVEGQYTVNAKGEQEREIDGPLAAFNLRTKKVDPSSLGIDTVKQYSGYLDNEEDDKHLFYWFFESRNDPKNDPVLLWLNGGPGCSSMGGLFMELGPSSVNAKGETKYNPSSWNANASVIFLDQPVNTGFSYSSNKVSSTVAAGKDIYALLTLFFETFPEYAKQDFHISGESYAGHYIPIFASEILSHKKRNINLKSVLIGNGLTDGLTQYEYYRPMACGDGGWPAVLDEQSCQSMDNALPRCQSLIESCYNSESVWSCVPASIYCNNAMMGPYQRTGQNVYDVREKCTGGDLCYAEMGWIADYLNQPKVKKALGVEVEKFDSCNFDVNRNFLFNGDWMKPIHRVVPGLLKEIPVLIYAGDADFICNWLGNLAWTNALEWPGQKKYVAAPLKELTLLEDGSSIGSVKSAGNFTFIRLHAGGHMVPYDQPEASLDMLNRWIAGEWFES